MSPKNKKQSNAEIVESPNKESADVNRLNLKLKHLSKEIKRYENRLLDYFKDRDIYFMKTIKTEVETLYSKLDQIYFEVLEIANETESVVYDTYAEAKDTAISILSKIEKYIVESDNNSSGNVKGHCESNETSSIKLPKFHLPIFYGDFDNWMSFREVFKSSIVDNKSLSNLQKMQYLMSNCKNNALKLISGFSLSDDNFLNTWETLCKRFDNKRELAFCQLNKIFNSKLIKLSNSRSLLEITDSCNEALRNLKSLGLERNSLTELIIINHFQARLDENIRLRWELLLDSNEIPSYDKFIQFLEKEAASSRGAIKEKDLPKYRNFEGNSKFGQNKSLVSTVVKSENSKCLVCSEINHPIHKCPIFNQMKLDERWKFVKSQRLCKNCLRKNHFVHNCQISTSCKSCKERHHTLLHAFKPETNCTSPDNKSENPTTTSTINTACYATKQEEEEVNTLLSTAIIRVKGPNGNYVNCRALLDNGSKSSLVSKHCFDRLNLKSKYKTHYLSGINQTAIQTTSAEVVLDFKSLHGEDKFHVSALVVDRVTVNLPNFKLEARQWSHLKNLALADPNYSVSSPVDILLGADIYYDLLISQLIHGEKGSPSAVNSKLGWLLSGRIFGESPYKSTVSCHAISSLDRQLQCFWDLETIPIQESMTSDETVCEQFYENTVKRNVDGRYIVRLPFKTKPQFGNSSNRAIRRFKSLEFKLDKDPVLKSEYVKFISEYIDLNHMKRVTESDEDVDNSFYLPHHFVIKADSPTTKLRVVFDASAKDSNGNSLNDMLHTGPKLQSDIFQILLRFRTFPVAVSADLEKMFRQILVNREDTDLQRIFWRFSPIESTKIYRLLTVTYGTACAPYLAIKTLHQLAKDEMKNFPDVAKIITRDFYVDDLLSGANSIVEAKQLARHLIDLMSRGGFNLRKWSCNIPDVLEDLPEESKSSFNIVDIEENQNHSLKVLGLFWNFREDTFQIKLEDLINPSDVKTKRQLLSFIAKIFDPLGFLAPTTILLKILMQKLWKDKLTWDDIIPTEIVEVWEKFKSQLKILQEIKLPRFISSNNDIQSTQLHGFADASMKAYSAVFYIRTQLKSGK